MQRSLPLVFIALAALPGGIALGHYVIPVSSTSPAQGESRDAAFTRRIVNFDPQAAAQWADTIANENTRNSQIESIAIAWLRTDPNRVTAWLDSSLPEEVKTRLLAR